jgi:hypothetical protein
MCATANSARSGCRLPAKVQRKLWLLERRMWTRHHTAAVIRFYTRWLSKVRTASAVLLVVPRHVSATTLAPRKVRIVQASCRRVTHALLRAPAQARWSPRGLERIPPATLLQDRVWHPA